MAEETIALPCETKTLEYHVVTLFEKLEELRRDKLSFGNNNVLNERPPMQAEVRSLEFWRSIISECLASFIYVFIVCGAAAGAVSATGVDASLSSILLATSLASGLAMATLTQCFGHISGAHVNPAVTVAMIVARKISPVRATMYLTAQCGGSIAGAALIYGVSIPGSSNFSAAIVHTAALAPWERFGVELILTFVVVFTYFISMDTYRKWMGSSALAIGASYSACTLVSLPFLNPARSLGPAFVLNKWNNHWVYWFGPLVGGILSGLIYEFIFNPRRHFRCSKESVDGDSSSMRSDEDNYDDLDKPAAPKFHGSTYNTYRPSVIGTLPSANAGAVNYCPSLASASVYSATTSKLNRIESLYGGTKSLYCKSPPLTRANLNRSQSVYTKSNCAINKDILPRPGPLVPAQSLYLMRLNQQQTHIQNQNVQNQMQQTCEDVCGNRSNWSDSNYGNRTEVLYGTGVTSNGRSESSYVPPNRGEPTYGSSNRSEQTYGTNTCHEGIYEVRNTPSSDSTKYETRDETKSSNPRNGNRPESMYGIVSGQQRRLQSEETYHGLNSANRSQANGNYVASNYSANCPPPSAISTFNQRQTESEVRQSPPTSMITTNSNSTTPYLHSRPQNSPNSQY